MTDVRPPRPAEAAQHLRDAMAYWQKAGLPAEDRLIGLVSQTIDVEIAAGQYAQAVDVAAERVGAAPFWQGKVIPQLANTAIDLYTVQKKPAEARRLIAEAMTLINKVNLGQPYVRKLREANDQINPRPDPPADRVGP